MGVCHVLCTWNRRCTHYGIAYKHSIQFILYKDCTACKNIYNIQAMLHVTLSIIYCNHTHNLKSTHNVKNTQSQKHTKQNKQSNNNHRLVSKQMPCV